MVLANLSPEAFLARWQKLVAPRRVVEAALTPKPPVIPAQAGIQSDGGGGEPVLDSGLRRNDGGFYLAYAIPDHPWVDSADGAAVRIAMTVGASGSGEGRFPRSRSNRSSPSTMPYRQGRTRRIALPCRRWPWHAPPGPRPCPNRWPPLSARAGRLAAAAIEHGAGRPLHRQGRVEETPAADRRHPRSAGPRTAAGRFAERQRLIVICL